MSDNMQGNILKRILKKSVTKAIRWYVDPLINESNVKCDNLRTEYLEANQDIRMQTNQMCSDIKSYTMHICEELKQMCEELKQMCEELKIQSRNDYEKTYRMMQKSNSDYEQASILVNSLLVKNRNAQNVCSINVMEDEGIQGILSEIKSLGHEESIKQGVFDKLGDLFSRDVAETLASNRKKSVAVVCVGLKKQRNYEAIRKEAYQIFLLLKNNSAFDVKMVSIEKEQKDNDENADIIYVSEENARTYFEKHSIRTLILVESTAGIVFEAGGLFLKYNMIVRLTGQNPLQGLPQNALEIMLHSNDIGVQHFMVQSEYAKTIMEKAGFKNVVLSYPVIETEKYCEKQKIRKRQNSTTIGFASSPMQEQQNESRGIPLLCELIQNAKEINFIVLWRDRNVNIPQDMLDADNCKIIYGYYDMSKFYEEIDCLLIPYTGVEYNHACSLSALEAMIGGIPVVCTSISGVSDIVNRYELGRACEPTVEGLKEAIAYVEKHYEELTTQFKINILLKDLEESQLVDYVLRVSSRFIPDPIVTFGEWDNCLKESGKCLIKGHTAIKEYYSQFEIAENYNYDRFVQYPLNCIDYIERKSICSILEDKFHNKNIQILDIAPGDGRIVQEDLKYGNCVAADASEAMLNVLKKRFGTKENLETLRMDYIETNMERQFDAITTFRYIRHFEYAARKELYKKIHDNLKEDGILIFDVPNIKVEMKLRDITGWSNYNIYDVFWNKEDMIQELEENGFRVEYIIAIGNGLMDILPEEYKEEPISWTFGAVRK